MGVGAIVLEGDRVLLIERGREPQKGLWSIPGGGLELGETLKEGVRREAAEETGLDVRVCELVELLERIHKDEGGGVRYHYVLADFRCEVIGGELRAGDDAAAARWVDRRELRQLEMTAGTAEVIEKAFRIRDES